MIIAIGIAGPAPEARRDLHPGNTGCAGWVVDDHLADSGRAGEDFRGRPVHMNNMSAMSKYEQFEANELPRKLDHGPVAGPDYTPARF
jgi:hypothetical protein